MRTKKTTALLPGALLLAAAAVARDTPSKTAPAPLEIYWVDVEGGAATLVVTPAGESVLIDAGNPGGRDAERIHRVAEKAGLRRIDHLIVTHFHKDHFGGVAELARLLPIGTLYERDLRSAPEREQAQPELAAYRAAPVEKRVRVTPGEHLPVKQAPGAARLEIAILGADQTFVTPEGAPDNAKGCADRDLRDPDTSDNRNSVVTLLTFGPFRFFDGADLTWNTEAALVCPRDRVGGAVDVFQIDHHGLDVSNNPVLLETLAPRVVVVNNGPRKGDGPATFATLERTASVRAVYQLHRNLVSPESNTSKERIANEAENGAGHFVELSVEPDGRSYAVAVPSTGDRESYRTRGD